MLDTFGEHTKRVFDPATLGLKFQLPGRLVIDQIIHTVLQPEHSQLPRLILSPIIPWQITGVFD